jgi:hypothetical protein
MKVVREAGKPLLIAVLAIAFGALLSLAKGSGEGLRLQMGNVSAPWLLAAFLAGSRYRRTGLAADSGVLATIAALSGFYAQQSPLADLSSASMRFIQSPDRVYGFIVTPHRLIFLGGIATGLAVGVLGAAWSRSRSRLALIAVAALFLFEPVVLLVTGNNRSNRHVRPILVVVAERDRLRYSPARLGPTSSSRDKGALNRLHRRGTTTRPPTAFYGIVITMYFRDHPPPHFHAKYGEHVAEIAIDTLELSDGWLPPRALRLVIEWAREHQDELRANWDRARAHEQLVGIDPLP